MRGTAVFVLVAISAAACSKPRQSLDAYANFRETPTGVRGEFTCKHSSSGGCDFTLYLETCQEPKQGSGCARQTLQTFSLKAGDSRVIDRLPFGARYCAKPQGSSDEPVCPPVPEPSPTKKPAPQTALHYRSNAGVA